VRFFSGIYVGTSLAGVDHIFARLFEEHSQSTGDSTHLKAHRTAASLLKKGLFPAVSGARRAA
jgi:hypothetical protein